MKNLLPIDIIPYERGYIFEYRQIATGVLVAIFTCLPLIFLWSDHRMTPVAAQIFILIFSLLLGLFSLYLLLNIRRLMFDFSNHTIIFTSGLLIRPYQIELPITHLKRLVLTNQKIGDRVDQPRSYLKWLMTFEFEGELKPFEFYEVNSIDPEAVYGIAIQWAERFQIELDNRVEWEIENDCFVKK